MGGLAGEKAQGQTNEWCIRDGLLLLCGTVARNPEINGARQRFPKMK